MNKEVINIKRFSFFLLSIFVFGFLVLPFHYKNKTEYLVRFQRYENDKFDIQYPYFKFKFNKAKEKKINQIIYDHMKGPLGLNPNMCIGLRAEIMYQDDHFVSIYYKGISYERGDGINNYSFAINIDVKNNQIVPIGYLINEKDLDQLKEKIANENYSIKFGYRIIENDDENKVNMRLPDMNDIYNFYLKDGFIGILINGFDVKCGNYLRVEIPYSI